MKITPRRALGAFILLVFLSTLLAYIASEIGFLAAMAAFTSATFILGLLLLACWLLTSDDR